MEMDKILEESYPYSIYKEFNNELVNATDETYCNEFKIIKQDYKEKSFELCKNVTKLLEFVFKKHTSEKYKDYCSHYKNWVYQEVRNLFNESTSDSDIEDVIKKFNKLQIELFIKHRKHDCSYRFDIKNLQGLNYKVQEKYLYDYFKNYNNIKTSETCNKCKNGKYKEYLKSISVIYDDEKENCCTPSFWDCSNYFLSCKDDFNPSRLLSALGSNGNERCEGLKSIKSIFKDEKSNPEEFGKEFMSAINYGGCYSPTKDTLEVGDAKRPVCILYSNFVPLPVDEPTARTDGQEATVSSFSADNASSISRVDPGKDVEVDGKGNRGVPRATDVKKEIPSSKLTLNSYKWSFKQGGKLDCRSRSNNKDSMRLCRYMEELVEGKFATQIEGTGAYKVQAGRSWTEDDLKPARERVWKRRSANESNILNNIFFRISTAVTLFTPFGSRLRRHRKRKQRYRLDFADLSTRKRPRRFLKRTYRHSDRRRFNVVNIEDELLSSNDLRNIN
ncbi:uncharacterized protein MKS88_000210 [Plasmodium brasilianum]|uniref:uncharacterized protein n=1 Tax=Plasmodium brasilianum TaxID=5824 RepID=UPI00350E4D37|nr:hypothetical protein MKS88_000210 [Plasmodium brasilianum]